MSSSWFTENFNDFSDEFFDELGDIKYYECTLDDIEPSDGGEDWEAKFQNLEPPPLNVLASFSTGSGLQNEKTESKLKKDSEIACEVPLQSNVWQGVDDLCNMFKAATNDSDDKSRTCSPVSVLDSSSSSVVENLVHCFPKVIPLVKRPRSKRFRRRTFPPLVVSSRVYRDWNGVEIDSGYMDANLPVAVPRGNQRPSNGMNLLPSETEPVPLEPGDQRRCTHCHVTKTPQWREGPMGPKTLCNACGVRFRSGRLYPEYRPAASPTFVASMHSNSHRKVLEMRKKSSQPTTASSLIHHSFLLQNTPASH